MRRYLAGAVLALACAVTATGCTGGDPEPSASPSATPTASRWQRGEIAAAPDLCGALTPDLLSRFGLETSRTGGDMCDLRSSDDDATVRRSLTVRRHWYEPPAARPDHTAAEEARHEFVRPSGWGNGQGVALRGYGDEAKISRTISTFRWDRTVSLAVRVQNVIFTVEMAATTEKVAAFGRVPPVAQLERDALDVTGALLSRLRRPVHPARAGAYRAGEVKKVHDVCDDVRDGAKRIPGAKRSGTSESTPGGQSGSCAWHHDDDALSVTAEAVRPGLADATSTAAAATRTWRPGSRYKAVNGLGDQASTRTYDGGSLRNVELWVRRGNLLIKVDYERWHNAPSAASMRGDAVKIAREVLRSYT